MKFQKHLLIAQLKYRISGNASRFLIGDIVLHLFLY